MTTTPSPVANKHLTVAVMSDLHCRLATDTHDSFLVVGAPRRPPASHPIQALISLIRDVPLHADALLIPGDLTNKSRTEGLALAWEFALEIGRELRVHMVVPTLGNHDIDSQKLRDENPIADVLRLHPDFPFSAADAVNEYLGQGCCVLTLNDDSQVVVLNTIIDHHDEQSAKHGTFGVARIEALKAAAGRMTAPIKLALMHHHPLLHSPPFLKDTDVIPTGDAVRGVLRDAGCRLIIHGHKHQARLRCEDGMVVFAAGSFSAILGEFGTAMGNLFHIIDIETQPSVDFPIRGTVRTWEFQLSTGWVTASHKYSGFPCVTGFGRTKTLDKILADLEQFAQGRPKDLLFDEEDVLQVAPELKYLNPSEYLDLKRELLRRNMKFLDQDEGYFNLGRIVRHEERS